MPTMPTAVIAARDTEAVNTTRLSPQQLLVIRALAAPEEDGDEIEPGGGWAWFSLIDLAFALGSNTPGIRRSVSSLVRRGMIESDRARTAPGQVPHTVYRLIPAAIPGLRDLPGLEGVFG